MDIEKKMEKESVSAYLPYFYHYLCYVTLFDQQQEILLLISSRKLAFLQKPENLNPNSI